MAEITTAEFAAALETDTRTVRKFLRSITPKDEQPGKGSRWVLDGNKRSITQMKKRFAEWTAERETPAEEETPEEVTPDLDELEPTADELEGIDD